MTNKDDKIKQLFQLKDKIQSMYTIDENDCWLWNGFLDKGYPIYRTKEIRIAPQKVLYCLKNNDPNSIEYNICDNKLCINPDHYTKKNKRDLFNKDLLQEDIPDFLQRKFHTMYNKKEESACWEWEFAASCGYGFFYVLGNNLKATRVSYAIHYGKCDRDKLVCHKCDNPKCVNPNHLWLGSYKENFQDMLSKNRNNTSNETKLKRSKTKRLELNIHLNEDKEYKNNAGSLAAQARVGDKANFAKLNEAQVREIKMLIAKGELAYTQIAKMYNVDKTNISMIARGKTWKHITI